MSCSEIIINSDSDESEYSLGDSGRGLVLQELEEHNLQVFLRIKNGIPFEHLYDIDEDKLVCKAPEGSHALRSIKEDEKMMKTYSFTKIFSSHSNQIEIFNDIVKAKMLDFINGNSSHIRDFWFRQNIYYCGYGRRTWFNTKSVGLCIIQDGTSVEGSTKSYSFTEREHAEMQQRLSSELVAEVDDLTNIFFSIWVSFAEVYNENIYDLLPSLSLGNSKDSCFIKDLTSIHISSGIEAYQILQFGLHNLKYAATSINPHSSRSHCIFTRKLIQVSEVEERVHVSTFNFCDLAGLERVKKTMNSKSNNINTSLLVLVKSIVIHSQDHSVITSFIFGENREKW